MKKVLEGLKQAVAFARGNCEHSWVFECRVEHDGEVKVCARCGVKITTYPPVQ